jgi:pimeloyl-ACP methyl ester carboxylesterase
MSKGNAAVNGTRLYFERAGSGPTLVLVPGENSDRRVWACQMTTFARRYSVLRYDLRGYGKSGWAPGPYLHAHDLATLLDRLGIEQAAFIAEQNGAEVAADLALAQPERVCALVLVTPNLGVSLDTPLPPALAATVYPFVHAMQQAAREPNGLRRVTKVAGVFRASARRVPRPPRAALWRHRTARLKHTLIHLRNGPRMIFHVALWPFLQAARHWDQLGWKVASLKEAALAIMMEANGPRYLKPPPMDRLKELRPPTLIVVGGRTTEVMR